MYVKMNHLCKHEEPLRRFQASEVDTEWHVVIANSHKYCARYFFKINIDVSDYLRRVKPVSLRST